MRVGGYACTEDLAVVTADLLDSLAQLCVVDHSHTLHQYKDDRWWASPSRHTQLLVPAAD